jgi:sugar lactone lactonase YvrE
MTYPLPRQFRVEFEELRVVASGLTRPECVLALSDGTLLAAHGGGGYSYVAPASPRVTHVLSTGGQRAFVPNGIALAPDGRVLFADLSGGEVGGLFAIDRRGEVESLLAEVAGEALPPTNYVTVDANGATWFSVSTRQRPRHVAWNHAVRDGFIGLIDQRGARIVADGLGYTNEVAFSPDGRWLYTNETYSQCVSRFALLPGPALGPREVVAQLDGADLPDGLTFDEHGGAWLTCIASNRLLVLRPDGELQVVLEDPDPEHVSRVVDGIRTRSLSPATMQTAGRSRLGNISSIAFGGADLRTAYLGCLLDDCIRAFDSPIAGMATAHWTRRVEL